MKGYAGYFRLFSVILIIIAIATASCKTQGAVVPEPEPIPERTPVPVIIIPEPPPEPIEPLIDMVFIPGGRFSMGDQRGFMSERPVFQVTLDDFYIGRFEVTQGQFFEVTGMVPSNAITNPEDEDNPDGWMTLPVESVNWFEALVFCNKLSIIERLEPVYLVNGSTNPNNWGTVPVDIRIPATWDSIEKNIEANGYRLPTEAEWEYAARGGQDSRSFTFAGSNNADTVAWYWDNSEIRIHEVGSLEPNELGLFDMSGNAMEWCWDWSDVYTASPKDNPVGPSSGLYRIIRGGSWSFRSDFCRVTYRHQNYPFFRAINLGFRVARNGE